MISITEIKFCYLIKEKNLAQKIYSKEKILEEAFKYCSKNGIEALSVRRLASKIGSSVMPIYDTFDSKEGLIRALVNYAIQLSFPTEGHGDYRNRCMGMLKFAMDYPLFYIDLVKLNKQLKFTKDHLVSFDIMMKNDTLLKELPFHKLFEINTSVEFYMMGMILWESSELPISTDRKENLEEKLDDYITRIIKSYRKDGTV